MEHIPYFDAHCDTIYRCLRNGAQLRENDGHLDLRRASAFGRFAQVFALYQDPEEVPQGSTMVREGQLLHQKFLWEMEQNRDVIVPCRTGGPGRGRRENGSDSLHRGGRAHRLRPGTGGDGGGMGRAVSQPRVELAQCPVRHQLPGHGSGPLPSWRRLPAAAGGVPYLPHISDPGFWDVVRLARGPVVATHSNSRALCPHRRNLTDDMFRAIRDSGGVVGLNLYRPFVGPAGTMEELVAAFEDAKKVKDRPVLFDIKVLPKTMTPGFESWWRVGVAEVSKSETVAAAYANMQANIAKTFDY